MMLIQAAANEWKVPVEQCSAANSVITHGPSGRTLRFGEVAEAAGKLTPPSDVKLKDPKDWKIAGKPLKRLDTLDKVTGKRVTFAYFPWNWDRGDGCIVRLVAITDPTGKYRIERGKNF